MATKWSADLSKQLYFASTSWIEVCFKDFCPSTILPGKCEQEAILVAEEPRPAWHKTNYGQHSRARPDRVEGCRKTHFMNLKLLGRRERCTHGHEIVMPWRGFLQICTALSNLTDNQLTIQRIFDLTIGNSMLKYRTEKEFFSDREGKRRRKRDGKEEKHVIPCSCCSCPRNHKSDAVRLLVVHESN